MEAFNVRSYQILNGGDSVDAQRYDIEAKPPETSLSSKLNPANLKDPPSDEQRQMLLSLLIDRFQLKFHRTTKEGPIYILTKSDKELKLHAPEDKTAYSWAGVGAHSSFRGINITMSQLANRMSGWLERPVQDQTELQGSFDFEYQTGDDYDLRIDVDSSIIASLNGLGLKLKSSKGPVEAIVVDHVEKPSAN
jgi:uncharacterized protein (TIGR03435 family)